MGSSFCLVDEFEGEVVSVVIVLERVLIAEYVYALSFDYV